MSKLENISALLVATNSVFTKEAAFTTKTTRAELIRMLQAIDFAVSEALEVAENYVKVSDQLFEDKEKLTTEVQELSEFSTEVQELNDSHVMQLKHLHEKCSGLEAKLADANTSNQELQLKLVDTDKALKISETSLLNLEYQVHKYKQQGFFDRLFGRTPE